MLLLAAIVAVVLSSAAATALAASDGDSANNGTLLGRGELGKNKDFSGLVGIGGGRTMYLECHGKGSPTVVLVSGFRGAHDDWTHVIDSGGQPKPSGSAVFPKVGKFTRVCAYDRPGTTSFDGTLSPSTPVVQPTTAQEGAADLHALLRAANQPGPYVLVAHSWGGLNARLYASTYPEEVSGLVLLDAGSEFLQDTLAPEQWACSSRVRRSLANPKPWKRPTTSPASMHSGLPLRWARSPLSCSPQISAVAFVPGAEAEATCSAWREAQDLLATLLDANHITHTKAATSSKGRIPNW